MNIWRCRSLQAGQAFMERLLEACTMTFPIHDGSPVRAWRAHCPEAADVVVIGGGIIGVMTAWHLAKSGLSVVLCEKGRVAGEQSQPQLGLDPPAGPRFWRIADHDGKMRLWAEMAETMPGLGFQQQGVMYLARSHEEMFAFEQPGRPPGARHGS